MYRKKTGNKKSNFSFGSQCREHKAVSQWKLLAWHFCSGWILSQYVIGWKVGKCRSINCVILGAEWSCVKENGQSCCFRYWWDDEIQSRKFILRKQSKNLKVCQMPEHYTGVNNNVKQPFTAPESCNFIFSYKNIKVNSDFFYSSLFSRWRRSFL